MTNPPEDLAWARMFALTVLVFAAALLSLAMVSPSTEQADSVEILVQVGSAVLVLPGSRADSLPLPGSTCSYVAGGEYYSGKVKSSYKYPTRDLVMVVCEVEGG